MKRNGGALGGLGGREDFAPAGVLYNCLLIRCVGGDAAVAEVSSF